MGRNILVLDGWLQDDEDDDGDGEGGGGDGDIN